MFCLASFTAIYSCFEPLVMMSYTVFPKCPIYNMPKIKCCGGNFRMELRQFLLACFSLSVTIVWAIFRKASWAWILQDILGIFFSINMLKTLRLPSLKIITVLLCTLFVYDIFFVFVTPLFTKVSEKQDWNFQSTTYRARQNWQLAKIGQNWKIDKIDKIRKIE